MSLGNCHIFENLEGNGFILHHMQLALPLLVSQANLSLGFDKKPGERVPLFKQGGGGGDPHLKRWQGKKNVQALCRTCVTHALCVHLHFVADALSYVGHFGQNFVRSAKIIGAKPWQRKAARSKIDSGGGSCLPPPWGWSGPSLASESTKSSGTPTFGSTVLASTSSPSSSSTLAAGGCAAASGAKDWTAFRPSSGEWWGSWFFGCPIHSGMVGGECL